MAADWEIERAEYYEMKKAELQKEIEEQREEQRKKKRADRLFDIFCGIGLALCAAALVVCGIGMLIMTVNM